LNSAASLLVEVCQPHVSRRLKLFASHLLISTVVVGIVAALVLFVWYPNPLFSIQGALTILLLLVVVDVIAGPLITLIVGSPKKPRRELVRDLAIIGTVQLAALIYGAHSLFIARPAFIVFNADRFDAISANEVVTDAPFPYRDPTFASAPVWGPVWVMARQPDSAEDQKRILFSAAMQGGPDIKDYPALYERWPQKQGIGATRLKPLDQLAAFSDEGRKAVHEAVRVSGLQENELTYVPLMGRDKIGVVFLNRETLAVVYASDAKPNY
jgi:hypothetical protein